MGWGGFTPFIGRIPSLVAGLQERATARRMSQLLGGSGLSQVVPLSPVFLVSGSYAERLGGCPVCERLTEFSILCAVYFLRDQIRSSSVSGLHVSRRLKVVCTLPCCCTSLRTPASLTPVPPGHVESESISLRCQFPGAAVVNYYKRSDFKQPCCPRSGG